MADSCCADEPVDLTNGINEKVFASIPSYTGKDGATGSKVSIVGVGQVGMACAYSILNQGLAHDIALVDVIADKLKGELMDMLHGTAFVRHCNINASTDYSITANSTVIIITAGVRQREGESRLALVQRNVDIFSTIVPTIARLSPNAVMVVVSNPVDIMTMVTWRLSGFPLHKVFGSGTMLDSGRFRVLLAQRMGLSPASTHGYIIGEHGDSSVAVWSSAAISGCILNTKDPKIGQDDDPFNFKEIHKQVISSAYEIIKLKGYTSLAIGLAVCQLARSIIHDQSNILTLSTNIKDLGLHELHQLNYDDVFLSLPCVVTRAGLRAVVRQDLTKDEIAQLAQSAKTLHDVAQSIKWPACTPPPRFN